LAIEGLRRRTGRQITGGLGNIARAFAHRNYLVYVSGNSISLIGWWLERVAVGWLTWTLTHSGAWLGLISLADFLPVLFLAPFAGVLAEFIRNVCFGLDGHCYAMPKTPKTL
jgi:hypothetical protein